MFERRNIQRTYLKISREVKDFLLSDKSREFFIFLFFFFVLFPIFFLSFSYYIYTCSNLYLSNFPIQNIERFYFY